MLQCAFFKLLFCLETCSTWNQNHLRTRQNTARSEREHAFFFFQIRWTHPDPSGEIRAAWNIHIKVRVQADIFIIVSIQSEAIYSKKWPLFFPNTFEYWFCLFKLSSIATLHIIFIYLFKNRKRFTSWFQFTGAFVILPKSSVKRKCILMTHCSASVLGAEMFSPSTSSPVSTVLNRSSAVFHFDVRCCFHCLE